MALNLANATLADRREAIRRWDDIAYLVNRQETRASVPDRIVTATIVDAYEYSVNMAFSDLPAITENEASYVAVKQWLTSGRSMGEHYDSMRAAEMWLDGWLRESRNR